MHTSIYYIFKKHFDSLLALILVNGLWYVIREFALVSALYHYINYSGGVYNPLMAFLPLSTS